MILDEILYLVIAPALAKTLLARLLEPDIAISTANEFIDLLKNKLKINDILLRKRSLQQFEEIGEQMTKALVPIFKDAKLDEESQTIVAQAVADTLNKALLTPKKLAQNDLDPVKLTKYLLLIGKDISADLASNQESLYERVIIECSSYILDITDQLPNLNTGALSEILKRQREILNNVNRLLEDVSIIRKRSIENNQPVTTPLEPTPTTTARDFAARAASFEEQYRRAVIRRLDTIELFGANISSTNKRYNLSVAYVTLTAKTSLPHDISSPVTLSVHEVIEKYQKLLILGAPGSGKTTILKWFAVNIARYNLPNELKELANKVPFFIPLRQFVEQELPSPQDFPKLASMSIAATMPYEWVHNLLQKGRAIVLIDGVDEIPAHKHKAVHAWIEDLESNYPNNNFIVTSRPTSVDNRWLKELNFVSAEIQSMTWDKVELFIDYWHRSVAQEQEVKETLAKLQELADRLKLRIQEKRTLRNIAVNPLLCAMMCAFHKEHNERVPSDKIELYRECINILVHRRDVERGVNLADYPEVTLRQKIKLLEDSAYWMLINNWTQIDVERFVNRLAQKIPYIVTNQVSPESIFRLLLERTSILKSPTHNKIAFTHRTFQEFLAANVLVEDDHVGLLISNAHLEYWREVVILSAGLASEKLSSEIITGLIDRGDRDKNEQTILYLLAASCLETAVSIEPSVRSKVISRLGVIIPPRNDTEARSLASAGNVALQFLKYEEVKDQAIDIIAVNAHAVGLIGGEEALLILEPYLNNRHPFLIEELLRFPDNFERKAFVQRIANPALSIIEDAPNFWNWDHWLNELDQFTSLKKLDLSYTGFSDIASLASLNLLVELNLKGTYIDNLNTFPVLENLKVLNLSETSIYDLNPLIALPCLETLDISHCQNLQNLAPLLHMESLKNLTFSYQQNYDKLAGSHLNIVVKDAAVS